MSNPPAEFWTRDTSVFFTSFWGWSPETWGCVGWTGEQGLARRTNLLQELSDPFVAVIYVTKSEGSAKMKGKIVGFYLMSHETGQRDDFTHLERHVIAPQKWVHSLRALRAFHYLPEYWVTATALIPDLQGRALAVSKWGEVLTNQAQIGVLRNTPWVETDVYLPAEKAVEAEEEFAPLRGFTHAGPANHEGYTVSTGSLQLKRHLYVLQLSGSTAAYLGKPSEGKQIYKIGLSASPALRKQTLQSAMPNGAFRWEIHRHSGNSARAAGFSFNAAVAGEDAMKKILSEHAEWLGGEFYLASETDLETAWKFGVEKATKFQKG